MRQLVLLRHAKAAANSDTGEDFDRPLAARGREDAPGIGEALAGAGAEPEIVLVSSANRTRETWALVASWFPDVTVEFLDTLYLADTDTLMRAAEATGARNVMLVAHNPGLHELASRLAHRNNALESAVRAKFPTAAGAVFGRADEASAWRLQAYITPKTISDLVGPCAAGSMIRSPMPWNDQLL